jgi:type I restriction enzyme S subunit
MLSKFSLQSLGTLISVQGGFAFKSKDFKEAGVPVLKIKNIRLRCLDYSDMEYVDAKVANDASRYFCQTGDILISMTGSGPQAPNSVVGRVARFTDRDGKFLFNQRVGRFVIKDTKRLDSRFLFFVLTRPEYQLELVSTSTGSANPANISARQIEGLRIPIPPFHTQKAIASILGALDDKIELNRRMNETLEAMAWAIFKDWIIDFGPTRAKQEGQAPYLAPDIWSLFPDSFVDDGLPQGWIEKPLDQVADFLNGIALQKYPAEGDTFLPVIKIAQLRVGNCDSCDKASTEIPAAYVVENGDVLFSWSGSLLHRVWTAGRGALNQHLFKVTSEKYPKWFFFHWISHHMADFQATAASKATTMGHIQRHHLAQAMTVVPDHEVMRVANNTIGPLFDHSVANDLECFTLAATRNLLLPKLMSGEFRIKDAAKVVEDAL